MSGGQGGSAKTEFLLCSFQKRYGEMVELYSASTYKTPICRRRFGGIATAEGVAEKP
jgi:hypothetical protein